MLKLKNTHCIPPGGFVDQDPDTRMSFSESNLNDLIKAETAHRVANSLSVDNLPAIIEDRICKRMPTGICEDSVTGVAVQGRHRVAETVVNETVKMNREIRRLNAYVRQEQAELRAAVCMKCKENIPFAGCPTCRGIGSIMKQMMNGRTLSGVERLKSCGVNGMLIPVIVFSDIVLMNKANKDRQIKKYPSECWIKKGG